LYESGSDHKSTRDPAHNRIHKDSINFNTKQGFRRRHPLQTLSSYAGVASTTETTRNNWEAALLEEHERVALPSTYTGFHSDQLVTHVGLTSTAEQNFKKSKPKLESWYLNGV